MWRTLRYPSDLFGSAATLRPFLGFAVWASILQNRERELCTFRCRTLRGGSKVLGIRSRGIRLEAAWKIRG